LTAADRRRLLVYEAEWASRGFEGHAAATTANASAAGMDQYQLWPSVVFLAMTAAIGGCIPPEKLQQVI
jgi:hypothetical protein